MISVGLEPTISCSVGRRLSQLGHETGTCVSAAALQQQCLWRRNCAVTAVRSHRSVPKRCCFFASRDAADSPLPCFLRMPSKPAACGSPRRSACSIVQEISAPWLSRGAAVRGLLAAVRGAPSSLEQLCAPPKRSFASHAVPPPPAAAPRLVSPPKIVPCGLPLSPYCVRPAPPLRRVPQPCSAISVLTSMSRPGRRHTQPLTWLFPRWIAASHRTGSANDARGWRKITSWSTCTRALRRAAEAAGLTLLIGTSWEQPEATRSTRASARRLRS